MNLIWLAYSHTTQIVKVDIFTYLIWIAMAIIFVQGMIDNLIGW